jgi:hypothetical protein
MTETEIERFWGVQQDDGGGHFTLFKFLTRGDALRFMKMNQDLPLTFLGALVDDGHRYVRDTAEGARSRYTSP